jgi:hypothetical protein
MKPEVSDVFRKLGVLLVIELQRLPAIRFLSAV